MAAGSHFAGGQGAQLEEPARAAREGRCCGLPHAPGLVLWLNLRTGGLSVVRRGETCKPTVRGALYGSAYIAALQRCEDGQPQAPVREYPETSDDQEIVLNPVIPSVHIPLLLLPPALLQGGDF